MTGRSDCTCKMKSYETDVNPEGCLQSRISICYGSLSEDFHKAHCKSIIFINTGESMTTNVVR